VIDHQHDNCTDDGHAHAVQVEAGYPSGSKQREQKSSDEGTDDAKDNIEDETFASLLTIRLAMKPAMRPRTSSPPFGPSVLANAAVAHTLVKAMK
jgi:hypothetical protein